MKSLLGWLSATGVVVNTDSSSKHPDELDPIPHLKLLAVMVGGFGRNVLAAICWYAAEFVVGFAGVSESMVLPLVKVSTNEEYVTCAAAGKAAINKATAIDANMFFFTG